MTYRELRWKPALCKCSFIILMHDTIVKPPLLKILEKDCGAHGKEPPLDAAYREDQQRLQAHLKIMKFLKPEDLTKIHYEYRPIRNKRTLHIFMKGIKRKAAIKRKLGKTIKVI